MFMQHLRTAAVSLCLLAPCASQAGPYSALYVFGDSLSDGGSDFALSSSIRAATGGLFPLVPGAPADYLGRFGNGKVAVDYLATSLGLALTPHYLSAPFLGGAVGGNNYAQGGATSGLENASLPATLTLGPSTTVPTGFKGTLGEVNDYRASHAAADPSAIYVVWGGANDFLHPGVTAISATCAASALPAVCQAVTNIAASVSLLAAMGATHILVPNLPDLGKTPSSIGAGPATVAGAHALSIAFNTGLAGALSSLSTLFPRDIVPFDTFALFDQVLADAAHQGFSNTTQACLTGSSADATSTLTAACAAAGPDHYVFWDDIHPTTHTQALLGQAFSAALGVPEPSEFALLGLGVLAFAAARRVKRRR